MVKTLHNIWNIKVAAVATDLPNPARPGTSRTSATFQINCAKNYVPLVPLCSFSINNNSKFLENMKKKSFLE